MKTKKRWNYVLKLRIGLIYLKRIKKNNGCFNGLNKKCVFYTHSQKYRNTQTNLANATKQLYISL